MHSRSTALLLAFLIALLALPAAAQDATPKPPEDPPAPSPEDGPQDIDDDQLGALFSDGAGEPAEGGGAFFDLDRLRDARSLTINGYVDATLFAPLTSTRLGEFGIGDATAALFFGAPIYKELVYASILLETGAHTGAGGAQLAIESAELAWTPTSWLRLGAGAFVVPFGLEDQDHASPQNPLVTRPLSFAGALVYPGTWSDLGVNLRLSNKDLGKLQLFIISGNIVHQRQDLANAQALATRPAALTPAPSPTAADLRVRQQAHSLAGGLRSLDATRLRTFGANADLDGLISGLDLGASALYGVHGHDLDPMGLDLSNWGVAAHVDLDLGLLLVPALDAVKPLPRLRAEFVLLSEERAIASAADFTLFERQTRGRYGYYVTLVQPLPADLELIARYDEFEPDTEAAGDRGLELSVGLRWLPVPNVALKLENQWVDAQGKAVVGANSAWLQGAVAW